MSFGQGGKQQCHWKEFRIQYPFMSSVYAAQGHDQTLPSCAAPELREALASLATLSSLGILASQIQDASRSQTSVWKVRGAFVRSRPSANCILTKLGAVERVWASARLSILVHCRGLRRPCVQRCLAVSQTLKVTQLAPEMRLWFLSKMWQSMYPSAIQYKFTASEYCFSQSWTSITFSHWLRFDRVQFFDIWLA